MLLVILGIPFPLLLLVAFPWRTIFIFIALVRRVCDLVFCLLNLFLLLRWQLVVGGYWSTLHDVGLEVQLVIPHVHEVIWLLLSLS